MSEVQTQETGTKQKNYLTSGKVIVQYIPNFKNGITDKQHPLYGGLSSNASIGIPAPLLSGGIPKIFEKDELEFLAKELNEESLAPNSEFWREFRKDDVGMTKGYFPIYLGKEGDMLDKSNPIDYIKLKILKNSNLVANSPDEIQNRASEYRFVLIEHDKVHNNDINTISFEKKATKLHTKFEENADVLRHILKSFDMNVSYSSKLPFLVNETWKLLKVQPKRFVEIADDDLIETKILVDKAVRYGYFNKSDGQYYTASGTPVKLDDSNNDYIGAAKFLASGAGQEMRLKLEASIAKKEEK